ncbi:hypothetical protein C7375_11638 [Frischella perrara]|nr:hypothetical protein C7375_11638 [Frischella perrara]
MPNKKYELTNDNKEFNGITCYRIVQYLSF